MDARSSADAGNDACRDTLNLRDNGISIITFRPVMFSCLSRDAWPRPLL